MKDRVTISDHLRLGGRDVSRGGRDPVTIVGTFSAVCRERGKLVPGTRRVGKNIWTLTGREYLARLMSYSAYGSPDTPSRNDRIRYIGFGIGSAGSEVSSVSRLVSPIAYNTASGGLFLAELAIPTYPFQTAAGFGTSVLYSREFSEEELSTATTVTLTEAGLFTDGSPTASPTPFAPGTRVLTLAQATSQAPVAYKIFEPLNKTQNFVLQTSWEVAF